MLVALKIRKIFANHFRRLKVKTLRQISAATILSLTLSVCVLAGQIEVNGVAAPPPPTITTTDATSTTTAIVLTVLDLIYG
jgi:hypothetical protein